MVPNWWSRNRQSNRLVQMSQQPRPCTWKCCTKPSSGGHRYGACQRIFDDKVSIWKFQESTRDQSYDVFFIVCTLYWFCGVFIYGSATSSRCGFNASLGNAFMLSNVGFNGPPMVYTVGLVIVRGIVYYIKWLSSICQWRGDVDGDVWSVRLSKRVHRSHQTQSGSTCEKANENGNLQSYTKTLLGFEKCKRIKRSKPKRPTLRVYLGSIYFAETENVLLKVL